MEIPNIHNDDDPISRFPGHQVFVFWINISERLSIGYLLILQSFQQFSWYNGVHSWHGEDHLWPEQDI